MTRDPAAFICFRCGRRKATTHVAASALDFVHGGGVPTCDVCVYEDALEHANASAAAIPELTVKLALAKANDNPPPSHVAVATHNHARCSVTAVEASVDVVMYAPPYDVLRKLDETCLGFVHVAPKEPET